MLANLWLAGLGYYGLAVVSAVAPWFNAEVLMLSAVSVARSRPALAVLVLAVSAGQMTGKAAMYWVGRTSNRTQKPAVQRLLDRWQSRFERHPGWAVVVTFVSALVGVPPFFAVSMAAGALRFGFSLFMAVGSAGRLAHFALVALAPELLRRLL